MDEAQTPNEVSDLDIQAADLISLVWESQPMITAFEGTNVVISGPPGEKGAPANFLFVDCSESDTLGIQLFADRIEDIRGETHRDLQVFLARLD